MAIVLLSIPLIPIPVITYISSDIHRQMQVFVTLNLLLRICEFPFTQISVYCI